MGSVMMQIISPSMARALTTRPPPDSDLSKALADQCLASPRSGALKVLSQSMHYKSFALRPRRSLLNLAVLPVDKYLSLHDPARINGTGLHSNIFVMTSWMQIVGSPITTARRNQRKGKMIL